MLYRTSQSGAADQIYRPWTTSKKGQTPIHQLINVRFHNGDTIKSFPVDEDAKAADLYRKAESVGIIDPRKQDVLWECSGRVVIPDDPSIMCLAILTPIRMTRQVNLKVFAIEQIESTVHITNGNDTKTFITNPGMRTSEIYRKAVDIGIMDNFHQFLLRYYYDEQRVLINDANPMTPPQTLLNSMDLRSPNDLRLIVSPIPEGVLLFAMFRDMAPNKDIPLWNWARFCFQNPWDASCASFPWPICIKSRVHVLNVPTWSGVLHLEHIPRSVHSMILKGRSVTVNLRALRFSSLTELTLDFEEISGIEWFALSGSSLEILRFPSYAGPQEQHADRIVKILNKLRAQGKIALQLIDFGARTSNQKVIWYHPVLDEYKYIHVDGPSFIHI